MFNYKRVSSLEEEARQYKASRDNLKLLIFRTVSYLNGSVVGVDSCVSFLRSYLDRADEAVKEREEREKIEQIVLALKDRKWEPAD